MADITNFSDRFRQLKLKLEVNYGTGMVDVSNYLTTGGISILSSLTNDSYGIEISELECVLKIDNPDERFFNSDNQVVATVSISTDNFVTQYDSVIFSGKTKTKKSKSDRQVKIEAVSDIDSIISKTPSSRDILTGSLTSVLGQIITNTTPTSYTLPTDVSAVTYLQNSNLILKTHLEDFLTGWFGICNLQNNQLVVKKLFDIFGSYTVKRVFPKNSITFEGFKDLNMNTNQYFTKVKVIGKNVSYINGGSLFSLTELFSNKIDANGTFFFTAPQEIGDFKFKSISSSTFKFRLLDDDVSTDSTASVTLSSVIIATDDSGVMSLVYKFTNSSANDLYLRELSSVGIAIKINGDIEETVKFSDEDKQLTLESFALQSYSQAENLVDVISYITGKFYKFEGLAYPDLQCGDIVTITLRDNSTLDCVISEIDKEFSLSKGFMATYTVYSIPFNNWFAWGVPGRGWGQAPWFGKKL